MAVLGLLPLSSAWGGHMRDPDLCHRNTWSDITAEDISTTLSYLGDPNLRICGFGESVLFMAAQFGKPEHVLQIINAGGDPDILAQDGCPVICRSMLWNSPDVTDTLLDQGVKIDVASKMHGHLIDRMIFFAPEDQLQVLFSDKHRSVVLPLLTELSWTAAIHRKDAVAMKVLLDAAPVPPTVDFYLDEEPITITPLMYAVFLSPSFETIELLLPPLEGVTAEDVPASGTALLDDWLEARHSFFEEIDKKTMSIAFENIANTQNTMEKFR